jgi:hypothetical protein
MKCVTVTMMALLFSVSSLRALVPRRVYPDRPLLGAPMDLPGFLFEPTNEMGVVLLFGMLFWRLGFIIESAQIGYPDCRAKLEVEPGRWQDVGIEFELYSRHFLAHRHDPRRADFIVCWIHDWKNCPPNLQVIELREVVRRLLQLRIPTAQFGHGIWGRREVDEPDRGWGDRASGHIFGSAAPLKFTPLLPAVSSCSSQSPA